MVNRIIGPNCSHVVNSHGPLLKCPSLLLDFRLGRVAYFSQQGQGMKLRSKAPLLCIWHHPKKNLPQTVTYLPAGGLRVRSYPRQLHTGEQDVEQYVLTGVQLWDVQVVCYAAKASWYNVLFILKPKMLTCYPSLLRPLRVLACCQCRNWFTLFYFHFANFLRPSLIWIIFRKESCLQIKVLSPSASLMLVVGIM